MDVEIYGSRLYLNASSIVSFNLIGHNYNDIATFLDQYGIMIRGGHHCCQPFMKKLKFLVLVEFLLEYIMILMTLISLLTL